MRDGHSSGISVTRYLLRLTRAVMRKHMRHVAPAPIGLAPGGVYHAANVAIGAVRSYRTLSPLPGSAGRFAFCGTFPGVSPAGCYPAPCFRGVRTFLPCMGRPSGHLIQNQSHTGRLFGQELDQGAPQVVWVVSTWSSSQSIRCWFSASAFPLSFQGRKWRSKAMMAAVSLCSGIS